MSMMNEKEIRGKASRAASVVIALVLAIASALVIAGCQPKQEEEVVQVEMVASDKGASDDDGSSEAGEADGSAPSEKVQAAQAAVQPIMESYGDQVAVTVLPLDGGVGFDINGDQSFVSASMIKLLILSELMEEAAAGTVSLDEEYVLDQADIVAGTGHINEQALGTVFTYDQLAEYMIEYSDNTATNVIINRLGMDSINARAESLDLSATDLQRMMMDLDSGVENHMSTNDAAAILRSFACDEAATPDLREKAEQYLLGQTDNVALPTGLPEGVQIGHKTGSLNEIRHDGGIVYAEDPYILVVFTSLGSGAGDSFMSEVSSAVYGAMGA